MSPLTRTEVWAEMKWNTEDKDLSDRKKFLMLLILAGDHQTFYYFCGHSIDIPTLFRVFSLSKQETYIDPHKVKHGSLQWIFQSWVTSHMFTCFFHLHCILAMFFNLITRSSIAGHKNLVFGLWFHKLHCYVLNLWSIGEWNWKLTDSHLRHHHLIIIFFWDLDLVNQCYSLTTHINEMGKFIAHPWGTWPNPP